MQDVSKSFSTCDLCDAFGKDETGNFRILPPVFHDFGATRKFCGTVATVKCFEDNSLVKAALSTSGDGKVLVVDGGASLRCALVGGNLVGLAKVNGWAGIVVNGCVRDVEELAVCPIGVRALGNVPMPPKKRNEGEADIAVLVQGVRIRPGDFLYADVDGIVIANSLCS